MRYYNRIDVKVCIFSVCLQAILAHAPIQELKIRIEQAAASPTKSRGAQMNQINWIEEEEE